MSDDPFPQPRRNDGGQPCGECHIQPGERCDICGAVRPTDTPALLPPDPSKMGRYWIKSGHTSDQEWTWYPDKRAWAASGWRPPGPENAALFGYTLATPHPIPGPAALEAVLKVIGSMDQLSADCLARRERYKPDSYAHGTCDGQAAAYATAANWLRAALETKEAT